MSKALEELTSFLKTYDKNSFTTATPADHQEIDKTISTLKIQLNHIASRATQPAKELAKNVWNTKEMAFFNAVHC